MGTGTFLCATQVRCQRCHADWPAEVHMRTGGPEAEAGQPAGRFPHPESPIPPSGTSVTEKANPLLIGTERGRFGVEAPLGVMADPRVRSRSREVAGWNISMEDRSTKGACLLALAGQGLAPIVSPGRLCARGACRIASRPTGTKEGCGGQARAPLSPTRPQRRPACAEGGPRATLRGSPHRLGARLASPPSPRSAPPPPRTPPCQLLRQLLWRGLCPPAGRSHKIDHSSKAVSNFCVRYLDHV